MAGSERDLAPGDIGEVVRRRGPLAAVVAVVVAGAFGLAALWETPLYTAEGSLVFNPPALAEGPAGLALSGESPLFLEAEVEIIRSRAVLEAAMDRAGLRFGASPTDLAPLARLTGNLQAHTRRLPEGPATFGLLADLKIVGPTRYIVLRVPADGAVQVEHEGRVLGEVEPDGSFSGDGVSLSLLERPSPGSYRAFGMPTDRAYDDLRDRLSLRISGVPRRSLTGSSAGVVTVTLRDPDPERARRSVQAVLDSFMDLHLSWRAQWGAVSSAFIAERLGAVGEELAAAENELESFRAANGILAIDAEAQAVGAAMTELTARLERQRLERDQLAAVTTAVAENAPAARILLGNMEAVDARELNARSRALAELEGVEGALALVQTASHPERAALNARIGEARHSLAEGLAAAAARVDEALAATAGELEEARIRQEDLPALTTELLRRQRQVEVLAGTYTFLLQKEQEAGIAQASTATRVQPLEGPVAAPEPDSPSLKWRAALGVLLGVFVGLLAGLGWEVLDASVHSARDLEQATGVPTLGTVPFSPRWGRLVSGQAIRSVDGAVDAAFDGLATALSLTAPAGGRLVSVTSSRPGEGKTGVVAGLAAALARTGAKVVAVDLDVRKRDLAQRLGVPDGPGVDLWLRGDSPPPEETALAGLSLMRAGAGQSLALQDARLEALLGHLAGSNDWVLLDSPPLVVPGDALWLAERADIGLLVVRAGRTTRAETAGDMATLRQVGAEPAGSVLVGARPRPLSRRYAERYYRAGG